jgi:NNP family nitrate/nitrite transporter-like MFS transporter
VNQAKIQLFLATAAFAISFALWGLLGALAPILKNELGLTQTQVALMVSIPVLLGSMGRIVMGILADRYGGRRVMAALLIVSIIPAAGIALSNRYGTILLWGFLLGVAGSSFSVGVAFTSKWFPPSKQGSALGIFGAGNIGQSFAVFFAPMLAAQLGGWKPVFWVFGAISVLWGLLFMAMARDARPGVNKSVGEMVGVLTRSRKAWLFSLFYFVTFGGFVAMAVYLPTLLTTRYDLTLADAGMRTAGFVLVATLSRPVGGWLSDRFGGGRILVGVFMLAVASALLLVPESFQSFTGGALSLALLLGLGNGAVFKLVPEYFPQETGTVTGLVGAFGGLGGFFPPLLLGVLLDVTGTFAFGFMALALFLLACGLLALYLVVTSTPRAPVFQSAMEDRQPPEGDD